MKVVVKSRSAVPKTLKANLKLKGDGGSRFAFSGYICQKLDKELVSVWILLIEMGRMDGTFSETVSEPHNGDYNPARMQWEGGRKQIGGWAIEANGLMLIHSKRSESKCTQLSVANVK